MDLYRVGEPVITEMWRESWTNDRDTGGLGTGVYAFRERWAAKQYISRSRPDDDLFVLHDALESPIQPTTNDATESLNRLSRLFGFLYGENEYLEYTYAQAREEADDLKARRRGFFGQEPGFGKGESLNKLAREVLRYTPELEESYGTDTAAFLTDFVDATEEAASELEPAQFTLTGLQPINKLLYPDFDGVAPLDGAGGNSSKHGCVVFKQRVDQVLGEDADTHAELDVFLQP